MGIDQLEGRYFRLRQELASAYGSLPWNTGHIDRLTDELAATEREIATANAGQIRAVRTPPAYIDSPRVSSH
jgi:hypothetical protein